MRNAAHQRYTIKGRRQFRCVYGHVGRPYLYKGKAMCRACAARSHRLYAHKRNRNLTEDQRLARNLRSKMSYWMRKWKRTTTPRRPE